MQELKSRSVEGSRASFKAGLGRCLVEGDPSATSPARRSRRKAFGASLAIESSLVALLVAAPLLTSVAQPQIRQLLPSQLTFVGHWHEQSKVQQVVTPVPARPPAIADPYAPIRPIAVNVRPITTDERPDVAAPDIQGPYIPGAIDVTDATKTSPPVESPHFTQPPSEKRPVKVSGGVMQAQLISRVEPRYPVLGVQIHLQGTVHLHAIISRDGRITSLEVVSGHPLLVQAALDAVRQWRYRPTLLDGQPVEVETTITVEFRLQN
jgi:periplasmic protein TonB